jgi:hypothetical protein
VKRGMHAFTFFPLAASMPTPTAAYKALGSVLCDAQAALNDAEAACTRASAERRRGVEAEIKKKQEIIDTDSHSLLCQAVSMATKEAELSLYLEHAQIKGRIILYAWPGLNTGPIGAVGPFSVALLEEEVKHVRDKAKHSRAMLFALARKKKAAEEELKVLQGSLDTASKAKVEDDLFAQEKVVILRKRVRELEEQQKKMMKEA